MVCSRLSFNPVKSFLEVEDRNLSRISEPGLPKEAREALNAILKVMSNWRDELVESNEKNGIVAHGNLSSQVWRCERRERHRRGTSLSIRIFCCGQVARYIPDAATAQTENAPLRRSFLCLTLARARSAAGVDRKLKSISKVISAAPAASSRSISVACSVRGHGLAILLLPITPVRALFWSADLNGLIAVPLMVATMIVVSSRVSANLTG
jgi:hypothetical protein